MTTDSVEGSEERQPTRYYVDVEAGQASSVSLLISDRRDYLSLQHDSLEEASSADPLVLIDQIADQSAGTPDYLLPDTPLKEAVFRVILANRNEPMTAVEVSEELKRRWTMSAYPRDLSPLVIGRLLENMGEYSIGRILPPEPEPVVAEAPAVEAFDEGLSGDV